LIENQVQVCKPENPTKPNELIQLPSVGVAFTPNGAFAKVSNRMSSDVSEIKTATNIVVATVSGVAPLPEGVAIKP
jgi:YVTN family beta-propeller protein